MKRKKLELGPLADDDDDDRGAADSSSCILDISSLNSW